MADLTITGLEALYQDMEKLSDGSGHYRRRVPASCAAIFVGIRKPSNARLVQFSFPASTVPAGIAIPDFRMIILERSEGPDADDIARETLTLCPSLPAYNDVFTSLVSDIASRVAAEANADAAFDALLSRLGQWQRLLQRDHARGLSRPEQLGLYGELYSLDAHLIRLGGDIAAVEAWTGPIGGAKDFEFAIGVAVEVKASFAQPPYTLSISSERQLEDGGFVALYLMHHAFEPAHGSDNTLPALVSRVRQRIFGSVIALTFEDKLLNAGYLDIHEGYYLEEGYIHKETSVFRIAGAFPRITRLDLPSGVGNITYSVSMSACAPYRVSADSIFDILRSLP